MIELIEHPIQAPEEEDAHLALHHKPTGMWMMLPAEAMTRGDPDLHPTPVRTARERATSGMLIDIRSKYAGR